MRAEVFLHYRWVMLNVVALLLFLGFFMAMVLRLFFADRSIIKHLEYLPLEEAIHE